MWKQVNPSLNQYSPSVQLELGLHYYFKVGAVNQAKLAAVHETDGVLTDNTPPKVKQHVIFVLNISTISDNLMNGFVIFFPAFIIV